MGDKRLTNCVFFWMDSHISPYWTPVIISSFSTTTFFKCFPPSPDSKVCITVPILGRSGYFSRNELASDYAMDYATKDLWPGIRVTWHSALRTLPWNYSSSVLRLRATIFALQRALRLLRNIAPADYRTTTLRKKKKMLYIQGLWSKNLFTTRQCPNLLRGGK